MALLMPSRRESASQRSVPATIVVRQLDAEHVLTSCPTYAEERRALSEALGAPIEAHKIVSLATRSQEHWTSFKVFALKAMKDRAGKELVKDQKAWEVRNAALRTEAARKKQQARRKMVKRKGVNPPPASTHILKKRRILPPPVPPDTG